MQSFQSLTLSLSLFFWLSICLFVRLYCIYVSLKSKDSTKIDPATQPGVHLFPHGPWNTATTSSSGALGSLYLATFDRCPLDADLEDPSGNRVQYLKSIMEYSLGVFPTH